MINSIVAPKNKSKYICYEINEKVSVDINGDVYLCPKCHYKEMMLGNVLDIDFLESFNKKRQKYIEYFNKDNYRDYWFSEITEYCIDMFSKHKDENNKYILNDDLILDTYFKEIVKNRINIDRDKIEKIYKSRIFTGF